MARDRLTLSRLGEDAFLGRLLAGAHGGNGLVTGPGDDCAVARWARGSDCVMKTDCVVEGRHYTAETPPALVGRKALARAVSDFAAMGARPLHALVTIFSPPECPAAYWRDLYRGLFRAAKGWGISIAGGELSAAPVRAVSVALVGGVPPGGAILRSGGNPGDFLYVTGRLGGSSCGHHLRFEPRLAEGEWLARNRFARAMIDLSDGLAADLPRLARASGCDFRADRTRLPRRRGATAGAAWSEGEDYELLVACRARDAVRMERAWSRAFPRTPLTRIGELVAGTAGPGGGFDHFRVDSRAGS